MFDEKCGMFAVYIVSGPSEIYHEIGAYLSYIPDAIWFRSGSSWYGIIGGNTEVGLSCGHNCFNVANTVISHPIWEIGAKHIFSRSILVEK